MGCHNVAPAKVNLTLDILKRRSDGYHLLESVMQTISLCDLVEVELASETSVVCDYPGLACDESNLAWRAYKLLVDEFALDAGVKISIQKQIPLGGGLAGGSTDAAQVLLAVNQLFELGLTDEQLVGFASRLGADVPFCLRGGTALASGVGEELKPLPDCPELRLVLVNPGFSVETAAVYRQFDAMNPEHAHSNAAMLTALEEGNPFAIRNALFNALEEPAFALFPKLAQVKAELAELGLVPLLCGSGATVMGVARDKKYAAIAAETLQGKYPFVCTATTK
jgi:4-diphosphocytidyl-2-C-methyl-D-erythritol kinase